VKARVLGVKQYFDDTAGRFDSIYAVEKPWDQKVVDAVFRKTVNQRFDMVMAEMPNMAGKSVLDVGTGSGRYAVELAARGAIVTGIDFSTEMLGLARTAAEKRGVSDRCRWISDDILQLNQLKERFHISLAIGFFDYIQDPRPFLKLISSLTDGTLYLSFPKRWTARTVLRKLRLAWNGCYVRFYTKREVEALLQGMGRNPESVRITSVNRDFVVKVCFA